MKSTLISLVIATLLLGPAAASAAGKGLSLSAGGRTVAGPGVVSLAMLAQVRVFTESSGGTDRCVTVVNTGSSTVQLLLTGGGTQSIDVAGGSSASLCRQGLQFADLTCTGTSSCTAQWRVDND